MKNSEMVVSQTRTSIAVVGDYIQKTKDFAITQFNISLEKFRGLFGVASTQTKENSEPASSLKHTTETAVEAKREADSKDMLEQPAEKKLTKPKLMRVPGMFGVNYNIRENSEKLESSTQPVEETSGVVIEAKKTIPESGLLTELSKALDTSELEKDPKLPSQSVKEPKRHSENKPKKINVHSLSYTLNYLRAEEAKKSSAQPETEEGCARARVYSRIKKANK